MRPNFRVVGDAKTRGFAEGFDGASWEFFDGKSKRTSGEEEAASRRGAEFDFQGQAPRSKLVQTPSSVQNETT